MTHAPADREYYDADSHIMELPNFLIDYADRSIRDRLRRSPRAASWPTASGTVPPVRTTERFRSSVATTIG